MVAKVSLSFTHANLYKVQGCSGISPGAGSQSKDYIFR